MRALLHYAASPGLLTRLRALERDWLEIDWCAESDDERFVALLPDVDVLWHALRPVTAEVLAAAPRLRLVQKLGVGLNTIDLDAARACGVAVANMPGTNSRAVAEATVLLMLAALRRVTFFDRATRAGDGWRWDASVQDGLGELAGRTVGVVGHGAVVELLLPILAAFGARLLYTARRRRAHSLAEWRELEALLAESDVVSLHVPLTPETERLLDARALARMKPAAVLVNTARGGLVDEAALVGALRAGRLGAAGLDVFAVEPTPAANPLLARDDVVVMPHVAWLTQETLERSLAVAVENCRRLRDGEPLLHRVA
jgi:phosphoglycerate dehydrogenase-like enzyme